MSRFKLLFLVIFIINLYKINGLLSDKRLCVDDECSVPISLAKTLLRYSSPEPGVLSFSPNDDVTIYSKSAGRRTDLWGAEIKGKRGYVPQGLVREIKLLQHPKVLVDTEVINETGESSPKQVPLQVEPDKVQQAYEVVDGTTIYDINPTVTDSSVQATELPESSETVSQQEDNEEAEEEGDDSNDDEEAEVDDVDEEQEEEQEVPDEEPLKNAVPLSAKLEEIVEHVQENVDIPSSSEESEEKIPEALETIKEETVSNDQVPPLEQNNIEVTTLTPPEMEIPEPSNLAEEEVTENPIENLSPEETPIPSSSIEEEAASKEEQVQSTVPPLSLFNHVSQEIDSPAENEAVQLDSAPTSEEQPLTLNEEPQNVVAVSEDTPAEPLFDRLLSADSETLEAAETPEIAVSEDLAPPAEDLDSLNVTSKVQVLEDLSATESLDLVTDDQQSDTLLDNLVDEKAPSVDQSLSDLPLEKNTPENIDSVEEQPEPLPIENTVDSMNTEPKLEPIQKAPPQEQIKVEAPNPPEEVNVPLTESPGFFDGLFSHFSGNSPSDEGAAEEQIEDITEETPKEEDSKTVEEKVFELNETVSQEISTDEKHLVQEIPMLQDGLSEESSIEEPINLAVEASVGEIGKNPDYTISHSDGLEQCEAEGCELKSTFGRRMEHDDNKTLLDLISNINTDIFIYLATTAISVIIFLLGYLALDKRKREGPLVGKINKLEKEILIILKENEMLQERVVPDYKTNEEEVDNLQQQLFEITNIKNSLEEQVHSLEKELENSTEVGLELNKMLTEILSSESGSDVIQAKVENLQGQLVEQQSIINSINDTLAITNTENHELKLELEITNKKVIDLQSELDKLLNNLLRIEEEKENQQTTLESQIDHYKTQYNEISNSLKLKESEFQYQIDQLTDNLEQTNRKLELKIKEYSLLTETLKQLKNLKDNDTASLLEVTEIKAEYQQLRTENERFREKLRLEKDLRCDWERKAVTSLAEVQQLKGKYEESEKAKVEIETKLEVLSNYFKDREAQYQRDISKHESLWSEKQGEATSTTERIKFMQEQLQNYKSQTESLKQEIVSQEVELKSQISVLEKKVHENWVASRQTERKLEESKQEAAQLRHRLTLSERALHDDKIQRLQSPMEQNGDLESPASPPLLFPGRDMMTKSPPIPTLPPFLPPPPGVPFMPPPLHGVPPFIPPPPNMFPGDHRPPPLGRMSSPPLNSRYSPSSRGYSPYDRNSSSPSDSEYGASPPHRRAYSPYNIREYSKRGPSGRINGRELSKGGSSGSGHSNESLEKINRQPPKV